ncbi:MAG: alpha/beta fold hydrolase [Candidatus Binatia bacterium]
MKITRHLTGTMLTVLLSHAVLGEGPAPTPIVLPAFPQPPPVTKLAATTTGVIYFASRTPYDFDILLQQYAAAPETTATGQLFLPPKASANHRVPGVVLVHGSGGITPGRELEYGKLLASNGYAALAIDYYRPRGVTETTPYALKVLAVTEFDAVTDAYAALRALNGHPAIDPKRVALVGFSYGGMATRLAMDSRVRQVLAPDVAPFVAHVDYYGPCHQDFHTQRTTGAALLSLRGGDDASNDLVSCAAREVELRRAGSAVGSVIYARAGHAWEARMPRTLHAELPYLAGCTISYDESGIPSVDGKLLLPASADPRRERRAQFRADSGAALRSCVHTGYIVGRDDAVKAQSDAQLLAFLRSTLAR